jgi:hypothetical protein
VSCTACDNGQPCTLRQNATTGRFTVERGPEAPAKFERAFDRNYEVQAYTGYPTSNVAAGQWNRGILYRQAQPTLVLQSMGPMFDPTDARTWPHRVG